MLYIIFVVLFVSCFFSNNYVLILQKPCHLTTKPTLHRFLFLKVMFSVDEKLVNNQNKMVSPCVSVCGKLCV